MFTWCSRLSNRLYSRLDNRLYRVNGVSLFMMVISVCLLSCSCCLLSPRAGCKEYFVDFSAIYRLLVYIVCFPTYPFFFAFSLLISFPLRIDPQAGCCKRQPNLGFFQLFLVALCNRADHYIFILYFLSIFFYLSFFPRLISAAAHWMSTILPHMVWP